MRIYKTSNYVSIDSRSIKKNSIYVAIKGEKLDGHKFAKDAIHKGAGAIIINKKQLNNFDSINKTIVTVEDTVKAFGELATVRKNKLGAKVISITGSAGKTSTKEMIAAMLSEKYNVHKTAANNNNHIGVPLTILSAPEKTDVLVLEHGTNHFNETKFTADIAQPDIALITNIGDSHLEFLINRAGVYKEKSALFNAAVKNNGLIIINNDDPIIKKEAKNYKNKITYGFKSKADVKGKILGYTEEGKTKIKVTYKNKNVETVLPVIGEAAAKNFLSVCVIAFVMGLSKQQILNASKKLEAVHGRLEVTKKNDFMIINDTYNSSPDSMKNAITLLNKISKYKRKVLIAGDMFELGRSAKTLHESLSDEIIKSKITDLYTIGKMMKFMSAKAAKKIKNTKHFQTRNSLINFLGNENFSNSVILFKGSRGMKMEEFLQTLINRSE